MTETTDEIYDFYLTLGRHIAEARKGASLKQQDIADAIGLSRASICNIEQGVQRPALHTLLAICNTVGVTITDLITGDTTHAVAAASVRNAVNERHMLLRAVKIRSEMRKLDGLLDSLIDAMDEPDEP